MRIGLLISDVAAILLGLIGLAALWSFAHTIRWDIVLQNGRLYIFAGFGTMMAVMTAAFLVPPFHQRILRATFPVPGRIVFILLSAGWLFFGLAYLRNLAGMDGLGEAILAPVRAHYGWVMIAALGLFALTIFPVGLSYADLRAERRAARLAQARAAEADRLLTPTRVPAARSAGRAPLFVPKGRQTQWQQAGPAGRVSIVISGGLMATIGYAFLIGRTTQTLFLDRLIEDHAVLAIGGLTALAWLYGIFNWRMIAARARHVQSATTTVFGIVLGYPLIIALLYFGIGYFLVPFGYHAATEHPVETVSYVVTDVDRRGKGKGCVTLLLSPEAENTSLMCSFGRDFGLSLQPGDILVATGERSALGHTLERIELRRSGN